MALLAICYPTLKTNDYKWIQSVRAQQDELNFQIVKPHFTLVFPVDEIGQNEFIEHVCSIAAKISRISFTLRCAVVVADSFCEYWQVFLVPDEGYSRIVKLHDQLYIGLLSDQLRLDIPYIPHIGIANSKDSQTCKLLADNLNREDFSIAGQISTIDIVSYKNQQIDTIEQINLIGA